ncbi:BTAD domain-containing putative transcriptional regulator [Amycolatopsis magusensis]|uniref:BTAD domain-containing putative transcriptional regulator n=1 Tax=Amycolatopsis magusensis TaxID=882444 RepID=UPI0024A7ABBF|nr:BTAD domain-containing putative transcriptional regulator [Amycolatopsis magusensis]MDI5976177.1 BTAD domain-containing putative transcriptional regulator [Amycolatopsis magusensis]
MTESLGNLLAARRAQAGLTQQDLATRAGVSVRTVRDIERGGVRRPHARTVRRLASAAGLDFAECVAALESGPVRHTHGADSPLRIEVLGSLTVHRHATTIDVGSAMLRRLLGLLTLRENQVVPQAEIIDFLWGENVPATYSNLVHTYVSRLRKLLGGHQGAVLDRVGSGYRLVLAPGQSDMAEFTERVQAATAHRAAGLTAQAADTYAEALSMWRGDVLADLGPRVQLHPVAVAASRQRLAAVLHYADLAIELRQHQAALDRLRDAAHADPMHEGIGARTMLALAGSGQRVAALRLFREFRAHLVEALGIEPGSELQDAYLRILRHEAVAVPVRASDARLVVTPAQLPPDISTFTGRERQIGELNAHLEATLDRKAAATISVISGTAGVGKSTLAVRWAHQVRNRYPHGQLYFNMHGYGDSAPRTVGDALTSFLQALGVSPRVVPFDLDARIAMFRSLLAERRVLLLLDNVVGSDQVTPLIPANCHCAVVVTSRNDLSGLKVRTDALVIRLPELSHEESVAMLTTLIRDPVGGVSRETVDELARLCAHLPLAMRIAAANISRGTHRTVEEYTTSLREGNRLAQLTVGGDGRTAVQAAFDLSYNALAPQASRLFRLLGLVPGVDCTPPAAAALIGSDTAGAARILNCLTAAHMVEQRSRDRYEFHDLLRLFAVQRSLEEDEPSERDEARRRLFEHQLRTAHHAVTRAYPGMLRLCALPDAVTKVEAGGIDWLEDERDNLAAMVLHAAEHGPKAIAWQLTDVLRGYLWRSYDVPTWLSMARAGLRAARQEGDRLAVAAMHYSLGCAHRSRGKNMAVARLHLTMAQRMFQRLGSAPGSAAALDCLGMVHEETGQTTRALTAIEESIVLCRREQLCFGLAKALCNLGFLTMKVGRLEESTAHLIEALSMARQLGDPHIEATALHNLGQTSAQAGQADDALGKYERALAIRRDINDIEGEGQTLEHLGTLLHHIGDPTAGRHYWHQAATTLEKIGHPKAREIHRKLLDSTPAP